MPTVNLGRVRPVWQGAYDSTQAYVVLDRVSYDGSIYECVADAPAGTAPTAGNAAFWTALGVKGDTGAQGVQGPQGAAGETPTITVDDSVSGQHTVTFTTTGQTQSIVVHDGQQGPQGTVNVTISTSEPTANDGANGDIWFTYEPDPEPESEPE